MGCKAWFELVLHACGLQTYWDQVFWGVFMTMNLLSIWDFLVWASSQATFAATCNDSARQLKGQLPFGAGWLGRLCIITRFHTIELHACAVQVALSASARKQTNCIAKGWWEHEVSHRCTASVSAKNGNVVIFRVLSYLIIRVLTYVFCPKCLLIRKLWTTACENNQETMSQTMQKWFSQSCMGLEAGIQRKIQNVLLQRYRNEFSGGTTLYTKISKQMDMHHFCLEILKIYSVWIGKQIIEVSGFEMFKKAC